VLGLLNFWVSFGGRDRDWRKGWRRTWTRSGIVELMRRPSAPKEDWVLRFVSIMVSEW